MPHRDSSCINSVVGDDGLIGALPGAEPPGGYNPRARGVAGSLHSAGRKRRIPRLRYAEEWRRERQAMLRGPAQRPCLNPP